MFIGCPKLKSLPQRFENENTYINEMDLINGFGRASLGFGSNPPTGSGRAQGSLHIYYWILGNCTHGSCDYTLLDAAITFRDRNETCMKS